MVVKSKMGRKRYIAFKVSAERRVEKRDIIRSLHDISSKLQPRICNIENNPQQHNRNVVRLIKFDGVGGIIFCVHYDKDRIIELLTDYYKRTDDTPVKLLGVSGTIRGATKKYLDKLNDYT